MGGGGRPLVSVSSKLHICLPPCRTLQLSPRVESPDLEPTVEGEPKKSPTCGPEDEKETQRLLVPDIQEIRVRYKLWAFGDSSAEACGNLEFRIVSSEKL